MVFDWFRRQYSQAQGKPQPEPEAAQPTPAEPAEPKAGTPSSEPGEARSVASETAAEPGTAIEEDYLAWAKAAYKNLKQQEAGTQDQGAAPEAAPSAVAPLEITPSEVTPSADTPEAASSEAASAEAAPSAVATAPPATAPPEAASVGADHQPEASPDVSPEASPKASPEASPEAEAIAAPEAAAPEAAAPKATEPAPVSFLQRAEADRQARLDRLKAEAPDEPETLSAKRPTQDLADPPLDEDFIWSAEVLAAQGRKPDEVAAEEIDWLTQLRQGLGKTRQNLLNQLKSIVGQGPLGAGAIEDIEAILLQADVGVEATDSIVALLQEKLRQEALPPEQAIAYLKEILRDILDRPLKTQGNPILAPTHGQLNVWLLVGVNGAGKTTTIGKLGHMGKKSGYECLIAAADTFRAAAVQQVQTWGDRTGIEVIANPGKNTDPAAVVFDALTAAKSRHTELLLVDTAGRLQNKKNLMAELSKIRRIIDKNAENAVVESLLVLDASLGQNGVRQAEVFAEAANLSGVVLTKLDGSAKGGVALAVTQKLGLPIRFVGAGEGIEDLRPFSSYEFVEALLGG
ncbi:MAG: signal recognition particle-docking protein FtsY [Prochlorothrix sp.]|nr:signal recognition particle-docking protein FtsY [Prochlorothrix sp.]